MPRRTAGRIVAKKAFSAKVEVTKQDAKKLKNLLPWRLKENRRIMWSDNWFIAVVFLVMGFALGLLV